MGVRAPRVRPPAASAVTAGYGTQLSKSDIHSDVGLSFVNHEPNPDIAVSRTVVAGTGNSYAPLKPPDS